jgi:hypothetical protein
LNIKFLIDKRTYVHYSYKKRGGADMPNFDGTGPRGRGSGSGRGLGKCKGKGGSNRMGKGSSNKMGNNGKIDDANKSDSKKGIPNEENRCQ